MCSRNCVVEQVTVIENVEVKR